MGVISSRIRVRSKCVISSGIRYVALVVLWPSPENYLSDLGVIFAAMYRQNPRPEFPSLKRIFRRALFEHETAAGTNGARAHARRPAFCRPLRCVLPRRPTPAGGFLRERKTKRPRRARKEGTEATTMMITTGDTDDDNHYTNTPIQQLS